MIPLTGFDSSSSITEEIHLTRPILPCSPECKLSTGTCDQKPYRNWNDNAAILRESIGVCSVWHSEDHRSYKSHFFPAMLSVEYILNLLLRCLIARSNPLISKDNAAKISVAKTYHKVTAQIFESQKKLGSKWMMIADNLEWISLIK